MAVVKIALPVVWRQNTNMSSHSYGKYYLETLASDPLLLAGLMRMCAWDQSVYTPEIVQVQKVQKVQPVFVFSIPVISTGNNQFDGYI